MRNKLQKYLTYAVRFANSPDKNKVINELFVEIKDKGIVTGIRSLLHKKSHFHYSSISNAPTSGANKGGENYYIPDNFPLIAPTVKNYSKDLKIALPYCAKPEVSIIIPMYNQVDITYNCIHSIFENNKLDNYEVIIADDLSTEDTSIIANNFENIRIIRNETNLGFLKNCNNAAQQAQGEYIVFLNNDTQVQKDWLIELLSLIKSNAKIGLVGSKLIYPDGLLQEAGGIIWQDGSAHNFGNHDNPNRPEYCYVKEADYISGASIMITKNLWKEIGGFDEVFLPAYCEDSDLCFQVRKRGYKVMYQPFSVVVHFEGLSHGTDLDKGIKKHQTINQRKFRERWASELKKKSKNSENTFFERDRTTGKKHVLVIDHYLPQVDKDAGSRTISNFIDALLDLDCSVKFMGENSNTGKHYEKMYQEKGVEVLYGNQFNFGLRGWRHYLKNNLSNFDAIILSRSSVCTPILTFLREQNYTGVTIYYGHDLGYQRLEKEGLEKGDNSLLKQAKKLKAIEDYMYEQSSVSLAISSEEIAYLRNYITKPVLYIPPYYFDVPVNTSPFDSRTGIFFIGGFNHPPNQDAMRWFLEEVYGQLDAQGISLIIAGSKMPDFIFNYKKRFKSLEVLPDVSVEELNAIYTKTRVAIVPLRSGAGVKGKVIEAMAKGVPVVGTDIAFEGMPKDEQYLYRGVNDPQSFAEEVIRVYNDNKKWNELAEFGKQYVRVNFNKEGMKQVFAGLLK